MVTGTDVINLRTDLEDLPLLAVIVVSVHHQYRAAGHLPSEWHEDQPLSDQSESAHL